MPQLPPGFVLDSAPLRLSASDFVRGKSPMTTLTTGGHAPIGLSQPGNLDLNARKVYLAPDGSYRTENSISIGTDQGEVLIPTIVGGRQLSDDDAVAHYYSTGENLGTFQTPEAADKYAETLHLRQGQKYQPHDAPAPVSALPPGFQLDNVAPDAPRYDGTDPRNDYLDLPLPGTPRKPYEPPTTLDQIGGALNAAQAGAMQGMTLGFGDEISAGLGTLPNAAIRAVQGQPVDLGQSYADELARVRERDAEAANANPAAYLVGNVVGGVGTGVGLARNGVTLMKGAKPTVGSIATRAALEGAGYGGVTGFASGDSLDDRINQAIGGATIGGGIGAVAGALAGRFANKAAASSAPSVEDLKAQASTLYDAAKQKGYTFPQQSVKQAADDIAADAISQGIDPTLHPGATAALKRLQEAGNTGMTVENAQTMRRILAAAAKDPTNPDQSRIASRMIDKFDDFLSQAGPELEAARGLYHQAKKGETIEQAIELAGSRAGQFSGSGFENALRTEFRALDRRIIKGQLKGLSDDEIAAIRKVANGGPIENALRYVGKLAPTGIVSFGISSGLPYAVGNSMGGPTLGAALSAGTMGTGFLARNAATGLTANNANIAAALARNGAPLAQNISPATKAVVQALIAAEGEQAYKLPEVPAAILSRMSR